MSCLFGESACPMESADSDTEVKIGNGLDSEVELGNAHQPTKEFGLQQIMKNTLFKMRKFFYMTKCEKMQQ